MASKIHVNDILKDFQLMLSEHWAYGVDTKYGQVDCSGAFVWSYKQHGHSIYHGSNRIARTEVLKLIPIGQAVVVPGMAAFKHRKPGESGYALPSSYQVGGSHYNGDLNDYYHIGLVDEDTARVLNAQSTNTGFVASKISQNWSHVAYLTQVDYDSYHVEQSDVEIPVVTPDTPKTPSAPETAVQPENHGIAVVYAENGLPVKMRQKASTSCKVWENVPCGTIITVRGTSKNGWTPVSYDGKNWYMKSEFLRNTTSEQPTAPDLSGYTTWAAEIFDLTKEQAEAIKRDYPSANIFETHG